jgi:hypothetical protein
MIYFAVVASYVFTAICIALALRGVDFRRPGFVDGTLVGAAFFVMVPMIPILLFEKMQAYPLRAPDYLPFVDLTTTSNLLVGVLALSASAWAVRKFKHRRVVAELSISATRRSDIWILFAIYMCLSVATFIISGKGEGGHWMENLEGTFATDTKAILVANFANAYRAAIFGALVYLVERRLISAVLAVVIGAGIAGFDLAVSFNRITFAYLAVMTLVIFRKRFWSMAGALALAAFPFSYLSNFWGTFRALALNDGFTFSGMQKAAILTNSIQGGGERSVFSAINGTFEASNIAVFNWIVASVPGSFEPLWGSTLLVRPLTVVVPSTFWPNKPAVFGTVVGEKLQGIHGLALNSTLFGEVYANFYFYWVFVLIAIVLIIDYIFSKIAILNPMYGACAVFVGFACWRFDFAFTTISLIALVTFEILRRAVRSINTVKQGPGKVGR